MTGVPVDRVQRLERLRGGQIHYRHLVSVSTAVAGVGWRKNESTNDYTVQVTGHNRDLIGDGSFELAILGLDHNSIASRFQWTHTRRF
jgi:hypothetical protein